MLRAVPTRQTRHVRDVLVGQLHGATVDEINSDDSSMDTTTQAVQTVQPNDIEQPTTVLQQIKDTASTVVNINFTHNNVILLVILFVIFFTSRRFRKLSVYDIQRRVDRIKERIEQRVAGQHLTTDQMFRFVTEMSRLRYTIIRDSTGHGQFRSVPRSVWNQLSFFLGGLQSRLDTVHTIEQANYIIHQNTSSQQPRINVTLFPKTARGRRNQGLYDKLDQTVSVSRNGHRLPELREPPHTTAPVQWWSHTYNKPWYCNTQMGRVVDSVTPLVTLASNRSYALQLVPNMNNSTGIQQLLPVPFDTGFGCLTHWNKQMTMDEMNNPTFPSLFNSARSMHPADGLSLFAVTYKKPVQLGYYYKGWNNDNLRAPYTKFTNQPELSRHPTTVQQYLQRMQECSSDNDVAVNTALVIRLSSKPGRLLAVKKYLRDIAAQTISLSSWRADASCYVIDYPNTAWFSQFMSQARPTISYHAFRGKISRLRMPPKSNTDASNNAQLLWSEYSPEYPVPVHVYTTPSAPTRTKLYSIGLTGSYIHTLAVPAEPAHPQIHSWILETAAVLLPVVDPNFNATDSYPRLWRVTGAKTLQYAVKQLVKRLLAPTEIALISVVVVGQNPMLWLGLDVDARSNYQWILDIDVSTASQYKRRYRKELISADDANGESFVQSSCSYSVSLVMQLWYTLYPSVTQCPWSVPVVWMPALYSTWCVTLDISFSISTSTRKPAVVWICYAIINMECLQQLYDKYQTVLTQLINNSSLQQQQMPSTTPASQQQQVTTLGEILRSQIASFTEPYKQTPRAISQVTPELVRDWLIRVLAPVTGDARILALSATRFQDDPSLLSQVPAATAKT